METRKFGSTDMNVSVLGFGGAEIGYEQASGSDVERLLNAALDQGLNVIDTAECYADSEEKIGQAVAHRRNDFFLFTKCGHASGFDLPDWNPKMLDQTIDRSLKRLQTECVDLVQLHSCSAELLKQGDVVDVLVRAREAGKTRYIGYSGDRENALYAVQCGAFDSLQTSVNIADQECLHLTLPKALATGMAVIAKRPIANAAWKTGEAGPANGYVQPYWERLRQLAYGFLSESSLDEAVGIALRFTLSQSGVNVAIVGTKNPSRWGVNSSFASQGALPSSQVEEIRRRWHEVAQPDWVGQT
ncbi:MAG: aldo/keto reductase [Fimbriimonas sp.]|nr:aldo/keto reductase [Fimbriimonas sp.]